MGTSQSSNGAPPKQPIVPPWAPDAPAENPNANQTGEDGNQNADGADQPASPEAPPMAPPARFQGARNQIGKYDGDSHRSHVGRGIKEYIKKGYGGSSTAAKRLSGTASTAGGLYQALGEVANNPLKADGQALSPAALTGKSADEIIDIIVEIVRPVDGTQDCEASRDSIKEALSDLLTIFPDADLQQLSEKEREYVIERFVAGDVFRRVDLDLGKTIRDRAPTTSDALSRLKDVKDYVKETVSAAFRDLAKAGKSLTNSLAVQIVKSAIQETCEVFEGYTI